MKTVLVEVYWSSAAPTEHKKTAHYQTWRDTVADMMAEPRFSVKYDNIFPDDEGGDNTSPSKQDLDTEGDWRRRPGRLRCCRSSSLGAWSYRRDSPLGPATSVTTRAKIE
jgi:hypothetical protein